MMASGNTVVITGMGVATAVGIGRDNFCAALKNGHAGFTSQTFEAAGQQYRFPVAAIVEHNLRQDAEKLGVDKRYTDKLKRMRHLSESTSLGTLCALEAWMDAGFAGTEPDLFRTAIISGGSNTQQGTLKKVQDEYGDKLQHINPNYGMYFFDTDIVGVLSELLGVRGEGYSIGAASASGNMAVIQGCRLIQSGMQDIVIVVAPMMELSLFEYQALTSLGAMAVIKEVPGHICRPFDKAHAGFVYGQAAGCLVLESAAHAAKRQKKPYAAITGYGITMDANRNPNPSAEGETDAMLAALKTSGILPQQIDYVNTHGTASVIGDETEVNALLAAGLEGVKVNSTKSLIGHALSAAGLVEAIAAVLQMKDSFLHKSNNLTDPISDRLSWVTDTTPASVAYAMNNSFGFGGINTSLVLKNLSK